MAQYYSNFLLLLSMICIIVSCKETPNTKVVQPPSPTVTSQSNHQVDSSALFQSLIRVIYEDRKGNFWFGTVDHGLGKYDGKQFTQYTTAQGLLNNQIRDIREYQSGNIWLSVAGGITSFNGKDLTNYNGMTLLKESEVSSWNTDPKNLYFEAGNAPGVFRYDGTAITYLDFPINIVDSVLNQQSFHPLGVYYVHEDSKGLPWFGTVSSGVLHFNGKEFQQITDSLMNLSAVRCVFEDADGQIWIGTNGSGVYRFDGNILHNLTIDKGLTNDDFRKGYPGRPGTLARVWGINQDKNGDLWFGTADSGVWHYDGSELTNYTTKNGLTSDFIATIYKDSKQVLWFGCGNGSVMHFNGTSFVNAFR